MKFSPSLPEASLVIFFLMCLLFWMLPDPQIQVDRLAESPSLSHPFGTDTLGRDLFLRVGKGMGNSAAVALGGVALTLVFSVAIALGLSQKGIFRFLTESLAQIFQSIPSFILVTGLSVIFQSSVDEDLSVAIIVLCLALTHWVTPARIIAVKTQEILQEEYVQVSYVQGASLKNIFWDHLGPGLRPLVRTLSMQLFAQGLIYESYLSFLGLGFQPPQASLGTLLQEGWRNLSSHPHLLIFPLLAVLWTTGQTLNLKNKTSPSRTT